tara:strand:+ start:1063 stop:1539 length:477 start_codon:yes stop_codon:yes gene_type:complete
MTNLNELNQNFKTLIVSYLIVLGIGMTFGLGYVYLTSEMNPTGMVEQYLGNNDEWEPKLPKTTLDLVSHAHDHMTMFSIIFLSIGFIFNQNSFIKGSWKKILMIEPFLSIIITFMGFFILRYITNTFAYIIMLSSGLMYVCFYIMLFVCLYELIFIKN